VRIPENVRAALKKPLGKKYESVEQIEFGPGRLVSVGDICTINLLNMGIRPHLAVFDFHFMRNEIFEGNKKLLKAAFPFPRTYENPPGTLSDEILKDAETLLEKGGAVLIEGEEDLTALAFILAAKEDDIIVYGQPNEGIVVVKPTEKLKKKIKGWLASASL
jgi:uncharacterized protein (UPF0218 family)